MTIFENGYKDDMTREEAVQLCIDAISAGIYHDMGSGSNVDYVVLTKDKAEMFRNAVLNKDLHEINL